MKPFAVLILSIIAVSMICGCSEEKKEYVKTCIDYASEVVSNNITLVRYYYSEKDDDYFWAYVGNDKSYVNPELALYWKDGTKFDMKTVCFMSGKTAGRFIDHYYNASCPAGNNPMTYRKMVVTREGVIVGYSSFTFVPELVPIKDSESSVKLFTFDKENTLSMQFEYAKKNVSSYIKTCTWYLENGTKVDRYGNMTNVINISTNNITTTTEFIR